MLLASQWKHENTLGSLASTVRKPRYEASAFFATCHAQSGVRLDRESTDAERVVAAIFSRDGLIAVRPRDSHYFHYHGGDATGQAATA
jgi:hypothetical protein